MSSVERWTLPKKKMSLIRIENLARRYVMGSETVHALRGVSLSIERGTCHGGDNAPCSRQP
jgi:ABC-type glutathione transport system ATPase component